MGLPKKIKVPSAQKMRDINPTNVLNPHKEARKLTPPHNSIYHPAQSLHHNDKPH